MKVTEKKTFLKRLLTAVLALTLCLCIFSVALRNNAFAATISESLVETLATDMTSDSLEKVVTSLQEKGIEINTSNATISAEMYDAIYRATYDALIGKEITVDTESNQMLEEVTNEVTRNLQGEIRTILLANTSATDSQASPISNSASDAAVNTLGKEVTDVVLQIKSLDTYTKELSTAIAQLQESQKAYEAKTNSGSADTAKEVETINASMKTISDDLNQVTALVAGLSGTTDLTQISQTLYTVVFENGEARKTVVDTTGMSVADYVGALAGNSEEYANALTALNEALLQLDDDSSEALSDITATLEIQDETLTSFQNALEDFSDSLKAETAARKDALSDIEVEIATAQENVNTAMANLQSAMESSNEEAIAAAKAELENAMSQMDEVLSENYSSLDETQKAFALSMQGSLNEINSSLESMPADFEKKLSTEVGKINTASDSLKSSLSTEISALESQMNGFSTNLTTLTNAVSGNKELFDRFVQSTNGKLDSMKEETDNQFSALSATDYWLTNIVIPANSTSYTITDDAILSNSDITISYVNTDDVPAVIYEQSNGQIVLNFKTATATQIEIDYVHIMNMLREEDQ